MIYEPQEDSFLLLKEIPKYVRGRVLEIGTGSGILAEEAAKFSDEVVAVDVSEDAVKYCKGKIKIKEIKFLQSDMFGNVSGKFDTIIFNPPYLPAQDGEGKKLAQKISGGKKGSEIIERFFKDAAKYLNKDGKILIVFSSLTPEVDKIIEENGFRSKKIVEQSLFFEKLFVFLVKKC